MARRAKRGTRSWYTSKLLEKAKRFAKERDGYLDQRSGDYVKGCNAHGSHVIPVSAGHSLAFDIDNIICLSYHNHMNWWHKNPLEASEWYKQTFPKRYKYLIEHKNDGWTLPTCDLKEWYEKVLKCKNWKEYKKVYNEYRYG